MRKYPRAGTALTLNQFESIKSLIKFGVREQKATSVQIFRLVHFLARTLDPYSYRAALTTSALILDIVTVSRIVEVHVILKWKTTSEN
jgi:hypothetical protein